MFLQTLIVCALCLPDFAQPARILGVIPTPSYSHQIVFQPIWRELARQGHDLVVATTDPINDPGLKNLKEIDLSFSYEVKNNLDMAKLMTDKSVGWSMLRALVECMVVVSSKQLELPEMQNLIHNKSVEFDLVMYEYISPIHAAFVQRFNCPSIGLTSLQLSAEYKSLLGNPQHPAVSPMVLVPSYRDLAYFERLQSTLMFLGVSVMKRWVGLYEGADGTIRKYFGEGYLGHEEYLRDVDMVFVNVNPVFSIPSPAVAGIVEFGGGIHLKPPKPLPKDIQTFLDASKNGVIYFSLGSNVKSEFLDAALKKTLVDTLSSLPYDVLWKFEEDVEGVANSKIVRWAPQQDVLRHPKVKAFISQCGLQSLEEALYSHVPIVGLPFFGDQPQNAKMVEYLGMGKIFNNEDLMVEEFSKGIVEVASNPKYKMRIAELAKLSKDQPMTGLQSVVWWTEYVIRNKGAKHLRSLLMDLPWYQYYMVDVLGFIAGTCLLSLYLIYKVIGLVCCCCSKIYKSNKVKTQ